jgi:hypothetical protein
MRTSRNITRVLMALAALVLLASAALAQAPVGPGTAYPADSAISDQKAGSVLFYNLYSSNAVNPNAENTRLNITNTSVTSSAFVHLFFVDGTSCTPADAFICLTPNQTASFLASDIDPGVKGYAVAVASDKDTGCPVRQNTLIGDEYVKLASGHVANLAAEAISALAATPSECNAGDVTASLLFDGTHYNQVPRVLAADNIPSQVDGNNTILIFNRVGGSLVTGAGTIGTMFGILYDDAETPYSFTTTAGCQRQIGVASFRLLGGGINAVIPTGRSGWLKIWATSDVGILGAELNANANTATSAAAFAGGHNLHKLTLTSDAYVIPIFPPSC